MSGGSFTVTNLGTLGVESFTPVINPPQVAILGVCSTVNRLKADGSVYPAMGLSLTFDHRALDGAPAARFLKDLCTALENFTLRLQNKLPANGEDSAPGQVLALAGILPVGFAGKLHPAKFA